MIDVKKETALIILETIDWRESNTVLFKKIMETYSQICICIKTPSAEESTLDLNDYYASARTSTIEALAAENFRHAENYVIIPVPNIINFSYTSDNNITVTDLS